MTYQPRVSKIDAWLRGILFALVGVVVGLALIVGMICLLLWNEVGLLQAERALLAPQPPAIVWAIRPLSIIGLVAGCYLISAPLSAFANIIPGIGAFIRFGTGVVSLAAGLAAGCITIALVWMFYRPWLSAIVLVVGAAIVVGVLYLGIVIANMRYKAEDDNPVATDG
jgi:transmembrane protein TMEM43